MITRDSFRPEENDQREVQETKLAKSLRAHSVHGHRKVVKNAAVIPPPEAWPATATKRKALSKLLPTPSQKEILERQFKLLAQKTELLAEIGSIERKNLASINHMKCSFLPPDFLFAHNLQHHGQATRFEEGGREGRGYGGGGSLTGGGGADDIICKYATEMVVFHPILTGNMFSLFPVPHACRKLFLASSSSTSLRHFSNGMHPWKN
jgi:hypothetical protein